VYTLKDDDDDDDVTKITYNTIIFVKITYI